MQPVIPKLISINAFQLKFGLTDESDYQQFVEHLKENLVSVVDEETTVVSLGLLGSWLDHGNNTHVSIQGKVNRRNENAKIGAVIVWLKRFNSFRGAFWSQLSPKSDVELFMNAKQIFHAKQYSEFLAISQHLEPSYSRNPIFCKMQQIATHRT